MHSMICINDDDMKHYPVVRTVRACCDSAPTYMCVCVCVYLGGKADPVEAPAHFRNLLQGVLLPPGLGSVDGVVVERLAG